MHAASILVLPLIMLLIASCRTVSGQDSELKLDEGIFDHDGSKYPMVWGIAKGDPSTLASGTKYGAASCTGTAISKTVIITASHCVKDNSPDQAYWLVNHATLALVDTSNQLIFGKAVFNPDSVKSETSEPGKTIEFKTDVALIQFPDANFQHTIKLAKEAPERGDTVNIVGYGYDSARNVVGRQYGASKVVSIINPRTKDPMGESIFEFFHSMIWISFDRSRNSGSRGIVNSGTLPGDSGGPLLIKGKLAGVLYGGTYWNDDRSVSDQQRFKDSLYANLQHPSNKGFLKQMKDQGWEIP